MERLRKFRGMAITVIGLFFYYLFFYPVCAAEMIKLEERTPMKVMIMESLRSGDAQVGQEVEFEVREDIYGPNREILICKGSRAYGEVILSKKSGMFGKSGKLDFTCDYVRAVDNTKVKLRCHETRNKSGKNKTGIVVATTLLVSVVGIFIKGKNYVVPKGTEFTVYVEEDTLIKPIGKNFNK